MMSHIIDGVLLVALVLTSLRVGAVYRELKRLRSYQLQYVQVFGETSRAAEDIAKALSQLRGEGAETLRRLEAGVEKGNQLAKWLETRRRVPEFPVLEPPAENAVPETSADLNAPPAVEPALAKSGNLIKSEMLKLALDTRRLQRTHNNATGGAASSHSKPTRELRMAPSVGAARAAGGNG